MTDDVPTNDVPAREYYTAQEIADLALEWGASATVTAEGDQVVIELERGTQSLRIDLGTSREFYDEMVCRGWVLLPSAPHRACDRWNELPYFGSFSVVYDEDDVPHRDGDCFVVRGVTIIEFSRCHSRADVMMRVLLFWYGLVVIQRLVAGGSTNLVDVDHSQAGDGVVAWWFGGDDDASTNDVDDG